VIFQKRRVSIECRYFRYENLRRQVIEWFGSFVICHHRITSFIVLVCCLCVDIKMTVSLFVPLSLAVFLGLVAFAASYSFNIDTDFVSPKKLSYPGSDSSFGTKIDTNHDFNGDGFNDILVNDPALNQAFVLYGGNTAPTVALLVIQGPTGSAGTFSSGCHFAGDVNHDGFADILIGDRGKAAYLIMGASSTTSPYSLTNPRTIKFTPDSTIVSNQFGWNLAGVGDVNNDQFDDFVICDHPASTGGGLYGVGVCYVVFGGNNLQSTGLSTLVGSGGAIRITGSVSSQALGSRVSAAGDINKDGFADFLIASGDNKNVYLIYGGASLASFTTTPGSFSGVIFPNPKSGDLFGDSIASAGDFNHDGFVDLMISSPSWSTSCTIWVVYGGASLPATFDVNTLTSSTGVRYFTNKADYGGNSIAGGGVDYNKDGFDDIIIGASGANRNQRGAAHVVFGSASPTDSSVFQLGNGVISLNTSSDTYNHFGSVVALVKDVGGMNSRGILVQALPSYANAKVYYFQSFLSFGSDSPTPEPTVSPSHSPSTAPTVSPSVAPSSLATFGPTPDPSSEPTFSPTVSPSFVPSIAPTCSPTTIPTNEPTLSPSVTPTQTPTVFPSVDPTMSPTNVPTIVPSFRPSAPTYSPSAVPTPIPTGRSKSSIVINTGFTMNSVNGATLTPTSQETIKQSIANASQTTVNNVDLVSVTRTNRRLLSSVGHMMLVTASLFSYKVVAEIHFNLIDFPGLNESYVTGTQSKVLMEAVKTHEFDRIISYYSVDEKCHCHRCDYYHYCSSSSK
jgi:hypothetical protein